MRQLSQPYGTRKEEFHCPHNVFSVAAPHLPPSAMDDIVNIVAKKIRTNKNANILPPKCKKIMFAMPRSCRGGPARLQRGRRCITVATPSHHKSYAAADQRGPYSSEKSAFRAQKSRFSASKSCTNCDFTGQPSHCQPIAIARAILRYLRPTDSFVENIGKMKAFKGLF